jgi:DNA processing protein
MTETLVRSLKDLHVTIVSGMAFGIDAHAHKAALANQLPTLGAVAHGLAYMYPQSHKKMAVEIIGSSGAIITEYWSDQAPDKHLFPARNRIVAGICDALVVVESGIKGGSMLTADLAIGYHKEVFAFPGRCTDTKSEGCNYLIKSNKAQLLSDPEDLAEYLGWKQKTVRKNSVQKTLPFALSDKEKTVWEILSLQQSLHIDPLCHASKIPMHILAAILLEMEMKGLVASMPGKMYCCNG